MRIYFSVLIYLGSDLMAIKINSFFGWELNKFQLPKTSHLRAPFCHLINVNSIFISVQAQAAEYLTKKRTENGKIIHPSLCKETKCVASTMFRIGIKKRNERKLHDLQRTTSKS